MLSNIAPKYTHEMVIGYLEGNHLVALNMQLNSISLIKSLFCEVNPIPIKAALNMIGFNVGIPRLPLVEMSENGKTKLKENLKKFGINVVV